MARYGFCYNPTGSRCSSKAQPGTLALRKAIRALYAGIGDLGIYNCRPTRGGSSLSTHGEGRGWDAACNATTASGRHLGDRLAADLVSAAPELGIQRVIWNRRQWDSKAKAWRRYSGKSPHTDHLHIELCWKAARDDVLTEDYIHGILGGDDMTPEETKQLFKELKEIREALYTKAGRKKVDALDEQVKAIAKKVGA